MPMIPSIEIVNPPRSHMDATIEVNPGMIRPISHVITGISVGICRWLPSAIGGAGVAAERTTKGTSPRKPKASTTSPMPTLPC